MQCMTINFFLADLFQSLANSSFCSNSIFPDIKVVRNSSNDETGSRITHFFQQMQKEKRFLKLLSS